MKEYGVNELQGEFNNLFFVMINYLFSEQKNVDWIFKSSFLSVTHFLRELTQPPDYIRDNTSYYQKSSTNYFTQIVYHFLIL